MTQRNATIVKSHAISWLRAGWKRAWPVGYLLLLAAVLFATRSQHVTTDAPRPRVLAQAVEEIPAPSPQSQPELLYAGVGSCAASGCHGGRRAGQPATSSTSQKEYLIWISGDPHAKAFSTLFTARSQQMVLALDEKFRTAVKERDKDKDEDDKSKYKFQLPLGTQIERDYYAALDRQHCIDCHGTRGKSAKVSQHTLWSDGVSCESCHGPADAWVDTHHQLRPAGVRHPAGFTANQKQGMVDLEDVSVRADRCAKCHVGSADGQVNHDLLAAGHPQLQFEFSDHMQRMQKFAHWDRSQDRAWDNEEYLARYWAVGQAETTRAALLLRAHRLADPKSSHGVAWPEFAEMDCRSCHHDLRDETWRGERAAEHGLFLPNTWYESVFVKHAPAIQRLAGVNSTVAEDLNAMQSRLQSWQVAPADRQAVRRQCLQTADQLAALSERLRNAPYTSRSCQPLLQSLTAGETTTWAEAAQRYNGLLALRRQSPQRDKLRDELTQLFHALSTDNGRQMQFDRDAVNQQFRELETLIAPRSP